MEQQEYLKQFESTLAEHLIQLLSTSGKLDGKLLTTDDFYNKWDEIAPSYVADSIKEIAKYPTVALGWAMYLGMAVAKYWDDEWEIYANLPNLYEYVRDKRGYDCMDEAIREDIIELKDKEYDDAEKLVQECAQQVLARIRHEQIEPQSPMAYYTFVSSVKVLYHIGASVQLKRMGYHLEKIDN